MRKDLDVTDIKEKEGKKRGQKKSHPIRLFVKKSGVRVGGNGICRSGRTGRVHEAQKRVGR